MFVYVKYNEINTGESTLTFNEVDVKVEVKKLSKGYAALKADELVDINKVIDAQDPQIEVSQISKELFVESVKDSETVKAIDATVGMRIRQKYSLDDELAMAYKADDSNSKIAFLAYRDEQIAICKEQKAELGL